MIKGIKWDAETGGISLSMYEETLKRKVKRGIRSTRAFERKP